jgi:hypothetical protein
MVDPNDYLKQVQEERNKLNDYSQQALRQRQQLDEYSQQALRQQQSLQDQINKLPTSYSQKELRQTQAGIGGFEQRQKVVEFRKEATQAVANIDKSLADVEQSKKDIDDYIKKVNDAKAELDKYEKEINDYNSSRIPGRESYIKYQNEELYTGPGGFEGETVSQHQQAEALKRERNIRTTEATIRARGEDYARQTLGNQDYRILFEGLGAGTHRAGGVEPLRPGEEGCESGMCGLAPPTSHEVNPEVRLAFEAKYGQGATVGIPGMPYGATVITQGRFQELTHNGTLVGYHDNTLGKDIKVNEFAKHLASIGAIPPSASKDLNAPFKEYDQTLKEYNSKLKDYVDKDGNVKQGYEQEVSNIQNVYLPKLEVQKQACDAAIATASKPPTSIFEKPQYYITKGFEWAGKKLESVYKKESESFGQFKDVVYQARMLPFKGAFGLIPQKTLDQGITIAGQKIPLPSTTAQQMQFGSYFIPYVGAGLLATDVSAFGSRAIRTGPIQYVKQNPIESAMMGAAIIGIVLHIAPKIKTGFDFLKGKYVPYEKTGVEVVPSKTIPRTLERLKQLEGREVPTVHTTLSKVLPQELKKGTILIAPEDLSQVGPYRQYNELFQFYRSAPLSPEGKPLVYGGYIGIGASEAESKVVFSLFPKRSAIIERSTLISEVPKSVELSGGLAVRDWIYSKSGVTAIPAENRFAFFDPKSRKFKISTEGQVVTSVKYKEYPGSFIKKVEGPLTGKFTIYQTPKETPTFFKNLGLEKPYQLGYKVFGKKFRIDFTEVKTVPVEEEFIKSARLEGIKTTPIRKVTEYSRPSIPVTESSTYKMLSKITLPSSMYKSSSGYSVSSKVSIPSVQSKISSQFESSSRKVSSFISSRKSISSKSSIPSKISSSVKSTLSIPSIPSILSVPSKPSVSSIPSAIKISSISKFSGVPTKSSLLTPIPKIIEKKQQEESLLKKKKRTAMSWRVLVKRRKKWKYLAGEYTRGEAIRTGVEKTITTLGRTFRVEPYRLRLFEGEEPDYIPSEGVFRRYRIIHGEKIPIENTWIQRAPMSLMTRSEVREIQSAKQKYLLKKRMEGFWES